MLSRLIALILIIVISPAMLIIFIISFIELGTNIFFFKKGWVRIISYLNFIS